MINFSAGMFVGFLLAVLGLCWLFGGDEDE